MINTDQYYSAGIKLAFSMQGLTDTIRMGGARHALVSGAYGAGIGAGIGAYTADNSLVGAAKGALIGGGLGFGTEFGVQRALTPAAKATNLPLDKAREYFAAAVGKEYLRNNKLAPLFRSIAENIDRDSGLLTGAGIVGLGGAGAYAVPDD